MTENIKMTNRKALEYVLENCKTPKEVQEKLVSMIAALDKKSSAARKPTADQLKNEEYKVLILDTIAEEGKTITEIIKAVPEFTGFNNQKIAALVRQLKDEGKAVRSEVKGRAYFARA